MASQPNDVRALMDALTADHIAKALIRIDAGETGKFSESTKYDLLVDGKHYPPKRAVGLALEVLAGRPFGWDDFKGGELSSCFLTLQRLGLTIVDKTGKVMPAIYAPGVTSKRQLKYGKAAWQLALDAVHHLGGSATRTEVAQYLKDNVPNFNAGNVEPDLSLLSVNSFSRGNYGPNAKPRRTDEGCPFDALYIDGSKHEPTYELYQPSKHGIWELVAIGSPTPLRPRLLAEAAMARDVEEQRVSEEQSGAFNPSDATDARHKTLAAIVRRQGQGNFRRQILAAYGCRCAISGCDLEEALEAAHIQGYLGTRTNVVTNGLLLRADIHTLFDLGLLRIEPTSLTVVLASKLADTHYGALAGRKLRLPANPAEWPNAEALDLHGRSSVAF